MPTTDALFTPEGRKVICKELIAVQDLHSTTRLMDDRAPDPSPGIVYTCTIGGDAILADGKLITDREALTRLQQGCAVMLGSFAGGI